MLADRIISVVKTHSAKAGMNANAMARGADHVTSPSSYRCIGNRFSSRSRVSARSATPASATQKTMAGTIIVMRYLRR